MRGFILGVFFTLVVIVGGAYLLLHSGKVSLATTAEPLPLEKELAELTLEANVRSAKDQTNPLLATDENMIAAAREFKEHCVFCHGAPGRLRPPIATMMMPKPPQLFDKDDMVVDDPDGEIFWIISNGIRLSGMPGFGDHLEEKERWQLALLLKHADKLPAAVQAELERKEPGEMAMHEKPGEEQEHADEPGHMHEHGREPAHATEHLHETPHKHEH
jgi:thiosulfate dehydrogenase